MLILFLAALGLVLIYTEFFLPGAIFAILGSIALLISSILCFMRTEALLSVSYLLFLIVATALTCKFALWKMKHSRTKDSFYLEKDQEGFVASSFDHSLIGKRGTVFTELKPAGHILIEGTQYQALSETGFLTKGEHIEVVGGKGSHLIVRITLKRTI